MKNHIQMYKHIYSDRHTCIRLYSHTGYLNRTTFLQNTDPLKLVFSQCIEYSAHSLYIAGFSPFSLQPEYNPTSAEHHIQNPFFSLLLFILSKPSSSALQPQNPAQSLPYTRHSISFSVNVRHSPGQLVLLGQ